MNESALWYEVKDVVDALRSTSEDLIIDRELLEVAADLLERCIEEVELVNQELRIATRAVKAASNRQRYWKDKCLAERKRYNESLAQEVSDEDDPSGTGVRDGVDCS